LQVGSKHTLHTTQQNMRFRVLTLVLMKVQVFWGMIPGQLVNTS